MDIDGASSRCLKSKSFVARKKNLTLGEKRPLRRKKLPCLSGPHPGYGCGPGMMMCLLWSLMKQTKEISTGLQEVQSTLADKVKPNQCKLQGPMSIGNLQICGDGCNNLTIHKPEKKRRRYENSQPRPDMENNCKASSTPVLPRNAQTTAENGPTKGASFSCDFDRSDELNQSHTFSKSEMNRTNFDKLDGVDPGNVQNCMGFISDDRVESVVCRHEQGGLVDADDDVGLDGQKQKVNGCQRNQVCLTGDDVNVCPPDSDVDYRQFDQDGQSDTHGNEVDHGGGCNVSRPDDICDIDEGGVVSGLPDDIEDGGIIPGQHGHIDDGGVPSGVSELSGSSTSKVSFSENIRLSAVKACHVGSNSRKSAVAETAEGFIADNNVNPQLVEGFEVPGREANPVMSVGFQTDTDSEAGFGSVSNARAGTGTCTDISSHTTSANLLPSRHCASTSDVALSSHGSKFSSVCDVSSGFANPDSSLNQRMNTHNHQISSGNDKIRYLKIKSGEMVSKMSESGGDSVGMEMFCCGCKGSCSDDLSGPVQFADAVQWSDSELVVYSTKRVGRSVRAALLDPVHIDNGTQQPGGSASFPGSVQINNDKPGIERSFSADGPGSGMLEYEGSLSTTLSAGMQDAGMQDGKGMKETEESLSDPYSAKTEQSLPTIGNGMKESEGGFSATKPQSLQAGYGLEKSEQSQKIGFPGSVEIGNNKPNGNDKPNNKPNGNDKPAGNNRAGGSFSVSVSGCVEAVMRKVQVSEGYLPVLPDSVQGHNDTAGIEGSQSPTLPLPVQAGDGTAGSEVCATLSDSGQSGFGTKETAGSLSAALPESGRPVLE